MELRIETDGGITLEELISTSGLDRTAFEIPEVPPHSLRTPGIVEVVALITALGGVTKVLSSLDALLKYCIEHSKSIDIKVEAMGIRVSAKWQRTSS